LGGLAIKLTAQFHLIARLIKRGFILPLSFISPWHDVDFSFFIYFNQSHKIHVPFPLLLIILLQNPYNVNIFK
jgi:hypothetical protein